MTPPAVRGAAEVVLYPIVIVETISTSRPMQTLVLVSKSAQTLHISELSHWNIHWRIMGSLSVYPRIIVSKKTWITAFLSPVDKDSIVDKIAVSEKGLSQCQQMFRCERNHACHASQCYILGDICMQGVCSEQLKGVTLLRIIRSRILNVMAGRRKGCQSSVSYPLHPVLW